MYHVLTIKSARAYICIDEAWVISSSVPREPQSYAGYKLWNAYNAITGS